MYITYQSRKRRGFGQLSTVAATIQQIEGYYPGSLAYTNNNPGNLRYAGQPGATGQDANGFAVFPTYAAGYQALLNQINLDASRGMTIQQFTNSYAPAADNNNPTSYAQSIASATGLSPSDSLTAAISGSGSGSSTTPDLSSGVDLSSLLPDLSGIDFTDPTTIAVTIAIGLGLAWALNA